MHSILFHNQQKFLSTWFITLFLLLVPPPFVLADTHHVVQYSVSIPQPSKREFFIQMVFRPKTPSDVRVAIPAWTPGHYVIHEFERNIHTVKATNANNQNLKIAPLNRRTWRIENNTTSPITISYRLRARDKTPGGLFETYIDPIASHGYINGAAAFLYLVEELDRPAKISFDLPQNWKIATGMEYSHENNAFVAKDYDELVDCPIQLGNFDEITFSNEGIRFECVLVGDHRVEKEAFITKLKALTSATFKLFGKLPIQRYLFIYHIAEGGFSGGLEHRNSTIIHLDRPIEDANYDTFLQVTSHEFVHTWNVKYLRPVGLGPFDYSKETRTPSLWFAEGVTDYYGELLLVRSGLRSPEWLIESIKTHITFLDQNPARLLYSIEEASLRAWEGQSDGYDGLSYYQKGYLLGLYFDVRLRTLTNGKISLDNVIQHLLSNYAHKNLPYPDNAILDTMNHLSQHNFNDEYNAIIRGTKDIPWEEPLAAIGIQIQRRKYADIGVRFVNDLPTEEEEELIEEIGQIIKEIQKGGSAEKWKLRKGDRIVAVNGQPVRPGSARLLISTHTLQNPLELLVERSGRRFTLSEIPQTHYESHKLELMQASSLSPQTQTLRQNFFSLPPKEQTALRTDGGTPLRPTPSILMICVQDGYHKYPTRNGEHIQYKQLFEQSLYSCTSGHNHRVRRTDSRRLLRCGMTSIQSIFT